MIDNPIYKISPYFERRLWSSNIFDQNELSYDGSKYFRKEIKKSSEVIIVCINYNEMIQRCSFFTYVNGQIGRNYLGIEDFIDQFNDKEQEYFLFNLDLFMRE